MFSLQKMHAFCKQLNLMTDSKFVNGLDVRTYFYTVLCPPV